MDEKQLIKQCLQNNRKAQLELYNLYAKPMLGLCYRYTKSLQDAEDVLQEGFIKVFTKLKQYDSKGEFGGWVRRIMITTAINYLQQQSKFNYEVELENAITVSVINIEPEVHLNTRELIEEVRKLPEKHRTIFNLVAIDGYSQIEIAELLEINVNTIRSYYSRGRAMLIKNISDEEKKTNALVHH